MKIRTVILDWAGTTIDFGSNAPVAAFMQAFHKFGISPDIRETREPMGMQKKAHIRKMLSGERLSALWMEQHGRPYTEEDIDSIYAEFEPALFSVLRDFTDPLPGVLETVREIRDMGILIGSTTGYTASMMNTVMPAARDKGYSPDCLVTPDEVGGTGRPFPYMLWKNCEKLGVRSITEVVKVGDTAADMAEGKNAGCTSVGIIKGSNMLGLNEAEYQALTKEDSEIRYEKARQAYFDAGADYVIGDITGLPALLKSFCVEIGGE